MENNLIDDLEIFAVTVTSIPINNTKIEHILYYDSDEFLQAEYLMKNNFLLQNTIINAKEKLVRLILKNLTTAINTNCDNQIDLEKIKITSDYRYSVRYADERNVVKRFKNHKITPSDENEFKKIWLKTYVNNLVVIRDNIKEILSITDNELPKNKLKTNLTVKEIAYLFRALYEEGIIEARRKTDIFNFIAESFSSKQKEDVSANSIKNAFDIPDFNAMDFWQGKFTHLMQRAKKDKENKALK